jgi:arsenate reductase (thioredoxin)
MIRNALFLCTANSARSILAEAILNRDGAGRWRGYSAGSHPRGAVQPDALALLAARGLPTAALRSKGWDEFAGPGAPRLDLVVTVCDAAAGETCPIWPGAPVAAHWGIPDPAAEAGPGCAAAFALAFARLERRIGGLLALDPAAPGFAAAVRALGAARD